MPRKTKGGYTPRQIERAVKLRDSGKRLDYKQRRMVAAWDQASGILPGPVTPNPAVESIQATYWFAVTVTVLTLLVITYVATR